MVNEELVINKLNEKFPSFRYRDEIARLRWKYYNAYSKMELANKIAILHLDKKVKE